MKQKKFYLSASSKIIHKMRHHKAYPWVPAHFAGGYSVIKLESAIGRFSVCGGSLWRHNSSTPQCDPTRRAFDIIGKFGGLSYDIKKGH